MEPIPAAQAETPADKSRSVARPGWHWAMGHPQLTSWTVTTAVVALYLLVAGTRTFFGDSDQYSRLSEAFRTLHFGNFADPTRGYGFPALLGYSRAALGPISDDPTVAVRLISLVIFPLLICVIVPAIGRAVSPAVRVTVPRLLTLSALMFIFWRRDLLYPLSDLPSLTLFAGAMALLLKGRWWGALLAGVGLGLAVNMRPAYLAPMVVALVFLFLVTRGARPTLARVALGIGGIALALLPQVLTNQNHYGSRSPVPVESGNLSTLQLTEGLRYERYDTYTGEGKGLLNGQKLTVRNPDYVNELTQMGHPPLTASSNLSLGEYASFVASHPLGVGLLYIRHLTNGLDTKFGGTYIEQLSDESAPARFLNFAVVSVAVVCLAMRAARRRRIHWRGPTTWFVLVLGVAVAQVSTSAIEERFLLPLQLSLLACFALSVGRDDLPRTNAGRVSAVVAVLAVVGLWFVLAAPTPAIS